MYGFREDYDENNRRIGEDVVDVDGNKYWVSTVDLGLDHSFGKGEPLYWETMIFPCDDNGGVTDWGELYCNRYPTKQAAVEGHAYAVEHCAEVINS
jgi:hypothetical protein